MDQKIGEIIDFWKDSAASNFETAEILFKNKKFDSCLFFCHLALEKMLKGFFVLKKKQAAPYIHDLVELADAAGLALSIKRRKDLATISTFNIAARYDSVKFQFYKQCTRDYAAKYLLIAKVLYVWLKKNYPKK